MFYSFFVGSFEHALENNGRFQIPNRFCELIATKTNKDNQVFLAPKDQSIIVYPIEYQKNFLDLERHFVNHVYWGNEVYNLIIQNKIYPCVPTYKKISSSKDLETALKSFNTDDYIPRQILEKLDGHAFEKLVSEIFSSVGINVQQNIRMLDAEIDLLLIEFQRGNDKIYSILECKNWKVSNKKVGISEVLRLYGLSQALQNDGKRIRNSIIVSSTPFSKPSTHFSRIHNIDLLGIEELKDWIIQNRIIPDRLDLPLYKTRILPDYLSNYASIKGQSEVTIIGVGEHFEIYNPVVLKEKNEKYEIQPNSASLLSTKFDLMF